MTIKDRLAKLIDVKSIVTLTLTMVFAYLSVSDRITPDQFLTIFSVIISFFFGVKMKENEQGRSQ